LDDENLMAMRLALPGDVLVWFVEPDPAARGELEEIRFGHRLEGRVLLQDRQRGS